MKVIYSIKSMKYLRRRIVVYHVVYYTLMISLILVTFFTMVRTFYRSISARVEPTSENCN